MGAAIRRGELLVFNIAAPSAWRRRALRITRASFESRLQGANRFATSEEAIISEILGPGRQSIRRIDLARLLHCSSDHVSNLVKAGALELDSRKTVAAAKASPHITRASLVRFLKARRVFK
jgi:hypothetical protein